MQISLAISVTRCREGDPEVAEQILEGHFDEAARMGLQRLWRDAGRSPREAEDRVRLGQMITRTLLALGRDQEAQEIMQELRKRYDAISRQCLRWNTALDQGWSFLSLNRPGRAIECFRALLLDTQAPAAITVEAMNCAADALLALGECHRATGLLASARQRCGVAGLQALESLVSLHELEVAAMHIARRSDELADHAMASSWRGHRGAPDEVAALRRALVERERAGAGGELLARRLQHLQMLVTCTDGTGHAAPFSECLAWLKDRRLAGLEPSARIESAMALLAAGDSRAAGDLLSNLAHSDGQARQSRYAMDLQYCRAKLLHLQGFTSDSLRAYKQHVEQAFFVIRRDLAQAAQLPETAPAEHDTGDAYRLRLPPKYRSAYQFIIDHIAESGLTVQQVAAHAGVTGRSLQFAFRTHLGMTPAELIRKRRMECIRDELTATGSSGRKVNVLDIAARWGVSSRSTLAYNYRQFFAETPLQTLHGKAPAEDACS